MPREIVESFRTLGSNALLINSDQGALQEAKSFLKEFESTLSRFNSQSELSRLNKNKQERVQVSPLLFAALKKALEMAEYSGGLATPVVNLEKVGYRESWNKSKEIPFADLAKMRPRTKVAKGVFPEIRLLDDYFIERPRGTFIDFGGSGKGLAADLIAEKWESLGQWCVSLGGDIRVGGVAKREVIIDSPLGSRSLFLSEGALATSGIYRRAWIENGEAQNHLIDPKSGRPVWGDFIQATAFARSALVAETKAKMALLTNSTEPLRENGGLILSWSGEWREVG